MIKKEQTSKDGIIDATKIGLWGTSLGGGHVLKVASENNNDPSIRAVVSQVPHLASGFESVVLGSLSRAPMVSLQGLGMFVLGLFKWSLFRIMGKTAYYPIVRQQGSAAMLQDPGDEEGYLVGLLASPPKNDNGWKNAATTVSGLYIVFAYHPLNIVTSIDAPVLLIAAEEDKLCPAKYVQQAKQLIKGAEFFMVPNTGHFDVYKGKKLQEMLRRKWAFSKSISSNLVRKTSIYSVKKNNNNLYVLRRFWCDTIPHHSQRNTTSSLYF
jgi:pimeloyl-ACP methyl ester carboxylesterase